MLVLLALAAIAIVAFQHVTQNANKAAALENLRAITAATLHEATLQGDEALNRDTVLASMRGTGVSVVDGLGASEVTWSLGASDD